MSLSRQWFQHPTLRLQSRRSKHSINAEGLLKKSTYITSYQGCVTVKRHFICQINVICSIPSLLVYALLSWHQPIYPTYYIWQGFHSEKMQVFWTVFSIAKSTKVYFKNINSYCCIIPKSVQCRGCSTCELNTQTPQQAPDLLISDRSLCNYVV